ncbi:DUF6090 family protein [Aegicerativicinus sediminis]
MLKVFRTLRGKLLNQSKFTSYIVYALGEIILVVIGILLALEINNWNENQKLQRLEVNYYENLLRDLQKDSIEYYYKENNALRNQDKLTNILNFIDADYTISKAKISDVEWGRVNIFKDTMALYISLSQSGFVQFPKIYENTISDLRSTGNIKLLRDESLKNALIEYYNFEKMFQDWNISYIPNRTEIDFIINRVLPLEARVAYNHRNDSLMYAGLRIKDSYPEFLTAIKKEPELEGLAKGMYHIHSRIINQCDSRNRDLYPLMDKVRQEISRLNSE